ncbi:MAG: helix-turn-helix domain-containing protein [Pseudomonadota bacterium]
MALFAVTSDALALQCPVRTILSKVTGKWQIVILLTLEDGPHRFGELKRAIGDITQRVLTENLRSLQRDGYLSRTVDEGPPVAVSYALTAQGRSLVASMWPLVNWAKQNMETIKATRLDYEAAQR